MVKRAQTTDYSNMENDSFECPIGSCRYNSGENTCRLDNVIRQPSRDCINYGENVCSVEMTKS